MCCVVSQPTLIALTQKQVLAPLNNSVRMIHVCVSNGQTAASANLTGNGVIIMSLEGGCGVGGRGVWGITVK